MRLVGRFPIFDNVNYEEIFLWDLKAFKKIKLKFGVSQFRNFSVTSAGRFQSKFYLVKKQIKFKMLIKLLTTRAKRAVEDSLTFTLKKVKVKVNQGILRGCEEKLPDGRPFLRFSGIPFAKPPINDLRFRSPVKLLKFDQDELDCTRERDVCFHKSPVWMRFHGSENCLNLNVYAPADVDSTKKLPVMVFIHGGAFSFDSNRRDL